MIGSEGIEIAVSALLVCMFVYAVLSKLIEEDFRIADIKHKEVINKLNNDNYTQSELDEIHSRGNLTFIEKADEWMRLDLCVPGDAIGSAAPRCRKFNMNCEQCLRDYASGKREHEPIKFEKTRIIECQ